ncbi:RibD family protein [Acuticoccus sp. I52.16.1]|uniref:RibD family protein n=1 Tax=Acuticoccus sp. I52.16.1 TaxID=2928472 RepID=UPI001FD36BBE|nr:RibD family protein [Acuticoccus sp. I52.16.1]UOM35813.1 RibD family protein [Acuticoccus sp. I52.16.1]
MRILEALREAAAAGRPLVVAQLGQSLDGRIATPTGHSHYINGPEAITLLHRLRAEVDAVVIGAGTARADDPRLTVRHVEGRDPARVLIDRRRSAGAALKLLREDGCRRIVFGPPHAHDPAGVETIPPGAAAEGEPLAPAAVLHALAERGLTRVLVEGGATTVSGFLAAGVIDRIAVLVAPMIIGSGPIGIALPPIDRLDGALRPAVEVSTLAGGDVVFDCDLGGLQNVAK